MAYPNVLPPELVLHILRNYIPIEDKLDSLWPISVFRPYLEDRGAWKTSSKRLSIPFLQWIHRFPSGWYLNAKNWDYQLFEKLDTYAMTLSFYHYLLDQSLDPTAPPIRVTRSFDLAFLKRFLAVFLNDFVHGSALGSPTYHLKSDRRRLFADPGPRRLIYTYDWEEEEEGASRDLLPFLESRRLRDEEGRIHFKVTLTYGRMLVVECLLPRGQSRCPDEVFSLVPRFEGEGGGPLKMIDGETTIKEAGFQTFEAGENDRIEGTMTYETKNLFIFPVNLSHFHLHDLWKV